MENYPCIAKYCETETPTVTRYAPTLGEKLVNFFISHDKLCCIMLLLLMTVACYLLGDNTPVADPTFMGGI